MLDQNTDRMWYVIGAVIVGAAIIFILNSTTPELFASVGDVFTAKAEESTSFIDANFGERRNLIANSDALELWSHEYVDAASYVDGWTRYALPTVATEFGNDQIISVQPATQYSQSFYVKTDAVSLIDPEVSFFYPTVGHYVVKTTTEKVGEDMWRVVGTGMTRKNQKEMRVPDIIIEFEGGTYAEFGQYQLEAGSKATPWMK